MYVCVWLVRWSNHLNPEILTSPWSLEEDMLIIEVESTYIRTNINTTKPGSITLKLTYVHVSATPDERAEVEGDRGPASRTDGQRH